MRGDGPVLLLRRKQGVLVGKELRHLVLHPVILSPGAVFYADPFHDWEWVRRGFHARYCAGFEPMPTYQYRCEKCGKKFERTETISELKATKPTCPKCGSKKVFAGQCLRGDHKEELTTVKHGVSTLTITALGLVLCMSTGATDSVQAGHHSRGYAAIHHAKAYTGRKVICYVTPNRATHTARKVCRRVGGYSHLTARRVLWGPAGMPPAPKDFGPHFDFPAHSLNSGPTEAPYPGW